MNFLLDTTFVLPIFGIDVQLKNEQMLREIWKNGLPNNEFFISSISLIEVMYKLNREYRYKKDPNILKKYELMLPTITTSTRVNLIDSHINSLINSYTIKIRHLGHTDLMDCWILGSAIVYDCIFVTEEIELKKLIKSEKEFNSVEFWNWNKFCRFHSKI